MYSYDKGQYEFKSKVTRFVLIGTIAQLVERLIRIQEARGSTPLCSIIFYAYFNHSSTNPTHRREEGRELNTLRGGAGLFIIYLN